MTPAASATAGSNALVAKGLRQRMAWLHTWCGLWISWLLFAIFLTGTLAVFEEPITHWMTPEHHADEAAARLRNDVAPAVSRSQRLAYAAAYMAAHHPDAGMWELWPSDAHGKGSLTAFWLNEDRHYERAQLSPTTGVRMDAGAQEATTGSPARATFGGHHFVDFHYTLHGKDVGLWAVAITTVAMLVALVSGVITHKRIFKDFFTFRPGKGQRSWLDAHNAVAVLSLPFQFMIAFTGLVFSAEVYLPASVWAHYGTDATARTRYTTDLSDPGVPRRSDIPLAVPDLEPFAARAEALMGQPVRAVVIDQPGDAAMRIGVYGWNDDEDVTRRLTPTTGRVSFSAATGDLLSVRMPGAVDGGAPIRTRAIMGNLHMAGFGGDAIRWLYFIAGAAGAAMMATGALLFAVKRRTSSLQEFGDATAHVYRAIDALNLAAIAGLGIACTAYLWANRLVPLGIDHRALWELRVFFAVWALSLVHACMRPTGRAWVEQMTVLAVLCLALPLLNAVVTGNHLVAHIHEGDWESAGVEGMAVLIGMLASWAAWRVRRRPVDRKQGRAGYVYRGQRARQPEAGRQEGSGRHGRSVS
ncbi:PepSY-associated TM helix domain-containing protein [Pigmentiphaga litoralis]|uniref:PepSY-associated TM helix domain-containing protein n=1 Tax=Pigmentiphaga litoralis TaxID=516702 RepID=UPI003B42BABA